MPASVVVQIVQLLRDHQLRFWIDGGWGVDALVGRMTRPHEDVDLVVELMALPRVLGALGSVGYAVSEDHAPVRVVCRDPHGRQIDLHPVTFDDEGTGWQTGAGPDGSDCAYPPQGFSEGRIGDCVVPCLSAEIQLAHHSGYEPRERDLLDMALLFPAGDPDRT